MYLFTLLILKDNTYFYEGLAPLVYVPSQERAVQRERL